MALDLKARIALAAAALEAETGKLSETDLAEKADRDQLAQLEEARARAEQGRIDLDLDRREDAARATLGDDVKIKALAIKGWPDTFILRYDPRAHHAWERQIETANRKKQPKDDIHVRYVMAVVHDWNGTTDFASNPESTRLLTKYLTSNPGLVNPLINDAGELAGLYARERKSGG